MRLDWVLLGLAGWAIGLVFALSILKMSGDQDRKARHHQKRLDPAADVTITKVGEK